MGDIEPAWQPTKKHHQRQPQRATLPVPEPTISHWQLPPHRLASHRSTDKLPTEADVVVVGSGITAAFFCLEFFARQERRHNERQQHGASESRKRPKIVVLEARTMCSGATGRNGGHLVVDHSAATHRRLWEGRAYKDVKAVVEETGIDCEFRELTNVMAYYSWYRQSWDKAKHGNATLEGGCRAVEDPEELSALDLKGDVIGALLAGWGSAATLCPYKLICGIWEKLERESEGSLNLQMATPVLQMWEDRDKSGYNNTVLTQRGSIRAKHVVVATNGYVSQLLEPFVGLVNPTLGQMTALSPAERGPLLKHDYGMHGLEGQEGLIEDYVVQRPWAIGGQFMHGGGRQWAARRGEGVSDDSKNDDEAVNWLRRLPERIFVGTQRSRLDLEGAWTGVMGYSRDGAPWVGKMPGVEGVWVSAGYTGHGMSNAPGCGRHVGRLVDAALNGEDWEQAQRDAVVRGEILEDFVLSEKRMQVSKAEHAQE